MASAFGKRTSIGVVLAVAAAGCGSAGSESSFSYLYRWRRGRVGLIGSDAICAISPAAHQPRELARQLDCDGCREHGDCSPKMMAAATPPMSSMPAASSGMPASPSQPASAPTTTVPTMTKPSQPSGAAGNKGPLVFYCDHGGGHCRAPMDLQSAAWLFMKDHPFGEKSAWVSGIPAGVPSYCKIF